MYLFFRTRCTTRERYLVNKIRHLFLLAKNFSLIFALSQLMLVIFEKMHRTPLRIYRWRNAYLQSVIHRLVQDDELLERSNTSACKSDTIYTMWLQGEDKAPKLVKICTESLRQSGHPVIVLDESNIETYIRIPECITAKLGKEITYAHFSDYVRFALLAKHGGAWMDSTIFCIGDMPEEVFNLPFFTYVTRGARPNLRCANSWWKGFAIGTDGTSDMFDLARLILESYWQHYDVLADYFLVDHVFSYCLTLPKYSHYCSIIPEQSANIYWLARHYNEEWNRNAVQELAFVNKLSYKDMDVSKVSRHSVCTHLVDDISS